MLRRFALRRIGHAARVAAERGGSLGPTLRSGPLILARSTKAAMAMEVPIVLLMAGFVASTTMGRMPTSQRHAADTTDTTRRVEIVLITSRHATCTGIYTGVLMDWQGQFRARAPLRTPQVYATWASTKRQ